MTSVEKRIKQRRNGLKKEIRHRTKFEPNEILAMGKFNPVKTKLSKFRPSSPITPNIILIFLFLAIFGYGERKTVGSSDIYVRITLKKKDMSKKY